MKHFWKEVNDIYPPESVVHCLYLYYFISCILAWWLFRYSLPPFFPFIPSLVIYILSSWSQDYVFLSLLLLIHLAHAVIGLNKYSFIEFSSLKNPEEQINIVALNK